MRWFRTGPVVLLLACLLNAGCQDKPAGKAPDAAAVEAEIQAQFAALDPETKKLVQQQRYCPLMPEVRLGEMGPPQKVILQGETVFLCCENCARQAQEDPD